MSVYVSGLTSLLTWSRDGTCVCSKTLFSKMSQNYFLAPLLFRFNAPILDFINSPFTPLIDKLAKSLNSLFVQILSKLMSNPFILHLLVNPAIVSR